MVLKIAARIEPPEPVPEDKCMNGRRECAYYQENCIYGVEQFMDENQCARCRCNEPCKSTICPEYTRCVVEQVQTYDQDARQFRAVCRECKFNSFTTRAHTCFH
jgi:papilin